MLQQLKSSRASKMLIQQKTQTIDRLLWENGLQKEKWSQVATKNLFKIFSISKHFSSLQEDYYRQKNIEYVKNLDPEDFTGKCKFLNSEKNYLDYLKNPDHNKFQMVILFKWGI